MKNVLLFFFLFSTVENLVGQTGTIWVIAPNGGEVWSAGSIHYITWENTPDILTVTVEHSIDAGATWLAVTDYETNNALVNIPSLTSNRVLWKVPNTISNAVLIRVKDSASISSDQSDSLFSITATRELVCDGWDSLGVAPFAGRDGAGALTFQGKMWLLGGWNPLDTINFPNICNSEVWSSSDGLTWNNDNPMAAWEARHTAGYVVFQNKMWIIGGDPIQGHYQPDVWNSSDGITWNLVNDSVDWGIRVLHHVLIFNDSIWVMGGQTLPQFAPETEHFYNDVWNSADGITWNLVTDSAAWSPRGMIGGNVVMNGKIWLLGGGTYDTPLQPYRNFFNSVWTSINGRDWEYLNSANLYSDTPWEPRQYHDVVVYNDRMWVLEGVNNSWINTNEVWYSDDGVNWYEIQNTPWDIRHAAAIYAYDSCLWVIGGNNMVSDVWKLQCQTDNLTHVEDKERPGREISVYPNPAQSLINVKVDSKLMGEFYTIYDNTGRVVLTGIINQENTTIELGNLSDGIYMFSIGGNVKQTYKIIKE